jgi:hypothetical protein
VPGGYFVTVTSGLHPLQPSNVCLAVPVCVGVWCARIRAVACPCASQRRSGRRVAAFIIIIMEKASAPAAMAQDTTPRRLLGRCAQ